MVQKVDPELNKKRVNKKGYGSLFSKREGLETRGTLYDEFVVYDPHQGIHRYIVHYNNLNFDPAAMPPSQTSTGQNLIRIQYKCLLILMGIVLQNIIFDWLNHSFLECLARMSTR